MVDRVELWFLADNRVAVPGTISTWGLSILVNAYGKYILFDTDSRWDIIEYNARVINAPIDRVEYIVISHLHGDHAGGLRRAIKYYRGLGRITHIILPEKTRVPHGTLYTVGENPVFIKDNVLTTGVLGHGIREQALIVDIRGKGPLVLVGCSHPGIENILKRTTMLLGTNSVYGLIGGYHISGHEAYNVLYVLEKYNVELIGPAHCTGDDAIDIFRQEFKGRFIAAGTGLHVVID